MESVVNLIVSAENIRMLVLLVFGFCGYVLMKSQMRGLEYSLGKRVDCVEVSLNKRIDCVEASLDKKIDSLDRKIDSVENTIEALTFTLEKNKFLSVEDRNFIGGRLDKSIV
jgi:prefoldin subunit 5